MFCVKNGTKKKSTSQSELRQMLSLRLQIQLPLLLPQCADGARVSVPPHFRPDSVT